MDLRTVASFRAPYEAHLARASLEAAGISAFVADEYFVGVNWLYSQVLGGVKVRVAESDFDEARRVLEARRLDAIVREGPTLETEGAAHGDSDDHSICPKCGAVAGVPGTLDNRLRALSFLLSVPLTIGRYRWSCAHCGHRWRVILPGRGAGAALANVTTLCVLVLLWLVTLPHRTVMAILDYMQNDQFQCWSCGATYGKHAKSCPQCAINLPDRQAYYELVEPGRAYDGACSRCHTPYAAADYKADNVAKVCSRCGDLLEGESLE